MLKTIKTTKYMRLDELIKYCFENDIKNTYFQGKNQSTAKFDSNGMFYSMYHLSEEERFEVEVEEEITEDTVFDTIFAITVEKDRDISYADTFRQTTIPNALRPHTSYLIAMVNDRPELVWEHVS